MTAHHEKMLAGLERFEKWIENMSSSELERLFKESKVTDEEAAQYAPLEKMLRGETVDGWRLAPIEGKDRTEDGGLE